MRAAASAEALYGHVAVVEDDVGQLAHARPHPADLLLVGPVEAGHEAEHVVAAALHRAGDEERREAVALEGGQPGLGAGDPRRRRARRTRPTPARRRGSRAGSRASSAARPAWPSPASARTRWATSNGGSTPASASTDAGQVACRAASSAAVDAGEVDEQERERLVVGAHQVAGRAEEQLGRRPRHAARRRRPTAVRASARIAACAVVERPAEREPPAAVRRLRHQRQAAAQHDAGGALRRDEQAGEVGQRRPGEPRVDDAARCRCAPRVPSASTASTPVTQRPIAPPGSDRLLSPSSSAFISTEVNGGANGYV